MTSATTPRTETVEIDGTRVEFILIDQGTGRTFLLLHGGGGAQSVAGFADLLASEHPARVLTPIHPGFNATTQPSQLNSARSLARVYAATLDQLDLTDVTVVGNSFGGWVAAELALLANRRISGVVLVNAVGLHLADHPIADLFALTMDEVADVAYYEPKKFRIDVVGHRRQDRRGRARTSVCRRDTGRRTRSHRHRRAPAAAGDTATPRR
jgi:pimeloyl-ACP methyl ester carboxylesterase